MTRSREVYLLDPQIHSPETIAVAFAKTSRSPESFRTIAAELTGESSAQFNEKWVVGYGHSSVAEHAVLHIAVENISRLAVECLESNRLASYTEKSTRYQKWNSSDFFIPDEFSDPAYKEIYLKTCQDLFNLYEHSLPAVIDSLDKEMPLISGETPLRRERIILTAAGDVCRFLLPVSAFANVGMTINARALEHAITKMLSHPLLEVQTLGKEIKEISRASLPTLLKYANEQPSLKSTAEYFHNSYSNAHPDSNPDDFSSVRLISFDCDVENQILSAAMLRYSDITYAQSMDFITNLDGKAKSSFLNSLVSQLDDHDIPTRELEYGNFLFEVIMDQGAYLEFKRHRMMTQSPSPFTPRFGYSIPLQIQKAGLLNDYIKVMKATAEAFRSLSAVSTSAASYVLPNAFNRHVLMQSNFRSLYHFLALRTAPNAHFSIRRIAQQMSDRVKVALPNLGPLLRINTQETADEIEKQYFFQV
jgi:thymidylate synthase ThyX